MNIQQVQNRSARIFGQLLELAIQSLGITIGRIAHQVLAQSLVLCKSKGQGAEFVSDSPDPAGITAHQGIKPLFALCQQTSRAQIGRTPEGKQPQHNGQAQQQQPFEPEAPPHARRNRNGVHETCAKYRQKLVIAVRIFAHISR